MCRKTLLDTLCVWRGVHFRWSEEHRSKHLWSKKVHRMRPKFHTVDLGNNDTATKCSCHYFLSSYLPCKHLFAVLRLTHSTWENLSPLYRQSPYLNLDCSILSDKALQKNENEVAIKSACWFCSWGPNKRWNVPNVWYYRKWSSKTYHKNKNRTKKQH